MPYRRKSRFPRRRRNRRVPGLATRPRMMPRTVALKRLNQVDSRVFWFKYNGSIDLPDAPDTHQFSQYTTHDITATQPQGWSSLLNMYDQYKVLGFRIKLFPANIGTEPITYMDMSTGIVGHIFRGNHVLWKDQRVDSNVQVPGSIGDIINNASAKMIQPRRFNSISIWRPKGVPGWGNTEDVAGHPDPWYGAVYHFMQDTSTFNSSNAYNTLFFYTIQYKVLFRGRQDS